MSEPAPEPAPTPEAPEKGSGGPERDSDVFDRKYVEELRRESAEHRMKAKEADEKLTAFRDAYRAALLREASAGVLHDPIGWDDSFEGEDGLPDPEKMRAAAEALAEAKPWLGRPRGDVGSGYRGEQPDTVDLADLLRAGA
jgi:hypothetical protein